MPKAYLQEPPVAVTSSPTPEKLAPGATVTTPHKRKHSGAEGFLILLLGAGALGFGIWEATRHGTTTPGGCPCGTPGCPACAPTSGCTIPDQTLAVDPTSAGIYVVNGGVARPIASKAAFDACGYEAAAALTPGPYTDADIQACAPIGPPVTGPPDCPPAPLGQGYPSTGGCPMGCGLLAQVPGTQGVYITDCDCVVHGIESMAAMDACGYAGKEIYPVLLPILDATPMGATITGNGDCVRVFGCNGVTSGPCAGPAPGSGGGMGGGGRAASRRRHSAIGLRGGGAAAADLPSWGHPGRYGRGGGSWAEIRATAVPDRPRWGPTHYPAVGGGGRAASRRR